MLPVAGWAVGLVVASQEHASPILLDGLDSPALFVGERNDRYPVETYAGLLTRLHTTAYTPIPLKELRSVLPGAHPRA